MSLITSKGMLDKAALELGRRRDAFARLGIPERIGLLDRLTAATLACAADQVRVASWAKGIEVDSPAAAEEWLGGPVTVLRNLRLLRRSLREIARRGKPSPGRVRARADGQVVAEVFPGSLADRLLLGGFRAEVWMEPGLTPEALPEAMASSYPPDPQAEGRTCLVLGAGNVASIGPMDVLYKSFVENQVCVLKLNPVNDYLGRFIEKAFGPMIDEGFLQVVYGGPEEGDRLVHHSDVDEIHITGSHLTHDAIVWGEAGEERERNKRAGTPLVSKRITSELGCVTPVVIAPGPWSEAELDLQAENVASMVVNNASFNCNAAKLLVTSSRWPQREAFLAKLRDVLTGIPPRRAYYPGSDERYDRFLAAYPDADAVAGRTETHLPWTLIPGLDPEGDHLAFTTEAWCGVLAETALDADGAEFLDRAAAFCNDRVWGTLSCSLLVHPKSRSDPAVEQALDRALAELRYGGVTVNHWCALGYGLVSPTWGAFPGHPLDDVQSGIGVVHNTRMFARPQKSVVHGPFVARPKPPWFATNKNAHKVAAGMARFEARGSLLAIPGVAVQALRG